MSAAPTASAPLEEQVNPYRWIILIGLVTAAIMEVLDTTIVNVALPQMMGNLNATPDEIAWVSTGYILSNVVILPMTAWLSGLFGRKRYLVGSTLLFIFASMMCGHSGTLTELVFWRIWQGAGGAALLSTAQATLVEIFPRKQMPMVQAIFGLGIVVAPTLGPALGGWITDNYSWPWCFYINLPIGIASATLVTLYLPEAKYARRTQGVDVAGITLLATGLAGLQYVLEEGRRYDWFDSPAITRLLIGSIVLLSGFVWWELNPKNHSPVVDFHVLRDRGLSSALLLGLALGFGLYGGVFIYPLFAQTVLNFTPTATGVALIPGGLCTGVAMIFCGRVIAKGADPRVLITFGMVIFTLSMWILSHLTTDSGVSDTALGLAVRGVGLGFLFIPLTTAAFSGLQGKDIAQGSSLFNLARQLGGSIGIAILGTFIDNMSNAHRIHLIQNVTASNPNYLDRLRAMTLFFQRDGFPPSSAGGAALGEINSQLVRQALTMAYNDAFLLIGITFCFAFPAIFLLKRRQSGAPAGSAGH